nr:hypothetical protein [Wenzhouxiangella limi]
MFKDKVNATVSPGNDYLAGLQLITIFKLPKGAIFPTGPDFTFNILNNCDCHLVDS